MKKFNLFNEIIVISKNELLQAINSEKTFGINIHGKAVFTPFDAGEILIYEGTHAPAQNTAIDIESALGKDLRIVIDDDRVLIKASPAWQEIIRLNALRASYDDTTGDGISEFSDKDLEEIGWHATEFNISYRDLVEILEEKCDGTLICIEQDEPYQFSGLGFVYDNNNAYETLYKYCQEKIKKMIAEDDAFAEDELTDDELEAAEYFKVL
ncbi:hypothetical protein [Sulfurimonas sp. HSL-1716]|uniref:hypothetical protein n=1 Tax=Hydrocurvibacter sulfurireducens TaxID=3131937 RepID=UPI0031F792BF